MAPAVGTRRVNRTSPVPLPGVAADEPLPLHARRILLGVPAASLAAAGIGLVVLAGWALDLQADQLVERSARADSGATDFRGSLPLAIPRISSVNAESSSTSHT
jgi:hypothetical protein